MTKTWCVVVAMIALSGLVGRAGASDPAKPDSAARGTPAQRHVQHIPCPATPFDTTTAAQYRERHAFSLDHFFESWPTIVMERRGPIGGDAEFSRYGIGRGRGALYLGYIPLNDPQDDRIPLSLFPTSLFGSLAPPGASDGVFFFDRGNIEGAYRLAEPPLPVDRPVVAVELSKGDRDLRQRRLNFSSTEGPIGIDFTFDELLNDAYPFDGRGLVEGSGYGRSATKIQGGNLRGAIPGGVDYAFSFRRFTRVFDGDLFSATSELRRDGHVAAIRTSVNDFGISIFERRHESSAADPDPLSTVPDSTTHNHTAGAYLSVPVSFDDKAVLDLDAGYEDIHSRQVVGGFESRSRLQKGHAGIAGRLALSDNLVAAVEANATHYFDMRTGWGAGVTLGWQPGGSNRIVLALERSFRMPNLGELYQPRHASRMEGSTILAGNPHVAPESALEASAGWFSSLGVLSNQVRATAMRAHDPIAYEEVSTGSGAVTSAQNGSPEDFIVLEERAELRHSLWGTLVELQGAVEYSPSDRLEFFSGVPEFRGTARAAVGRELFKNSCGVRIAAEFVHCGERAAGSVDALPAYDVINMKLVVRLIDAHLYVQWLNVTDEKYQTVWPYMMTPRTFVYGVQWTIFD